MELVNNLRRWREGASLSREQLAERVGVSPVSIYRIERGQQQPRPALLDQMCHLFGKHPADFYSGAPNVVEASAGSRRIPILDFVSAGNFAVIANAVNAELEECILTDLNPSPESFALRIRGRSMEPEFAEGDVVVIDPAVYPRAEDYVVAVDENGEGSFKRYHDVGLNDKAQRVFELVSLNPAYPSWRSDRQEIKVRGTMVEHRRFRRK